MPLLATLGTAALGSLTLQPTYSVTSSVSTINEGDSITFNISTTNAINGTILYWNIPSTGNLPSFQNGTRNGSFTINNNSGSVTVNTVVLNDNRVFDPPSSYEFYLEIKTVSVSGNTVSTSDNIIVNNTWGARSYSTAGSYTFVVPAGVTRISFAAIGGGGGGGVGDENYGAGGGGACAYRNNVAVTPGESISIIVGAGGAGAPSTTLNFAGAGSPGSPGGFSRVTVNGVSTTAGGGSGGQGNGLQASGGTISGTTSGGGSGGSGGAKLAAGGGGSGGFTGTGGNGARWWSPAVSATAGSGGGGGGGGTGRVNTSTSSAARGGFGGTGGAQSNGAAGANTTVLGGNNNGGSGSSTFSTAGGGAGAYGGNSGTATVSGASGTRGAVMIVWPGNTRQFPSTNITPF